MLDKVADIFKTAGEITVSPIVTPLAAIGDLVMKIKGDYDESEALAYLKDIKDRFKNNNFTKLNLYTGAFVSGGVIVSVMFGYTKDQVKNSDRWIDYITSTDSEVSDQERLSYHGGGTQSVVPETVAIIAKAGGRGFKKVYSLDNFEKALRDLAGFLNNNSDHAFPVKA